ncbi:hypothetical protein [Rhodosalinus sediminis]|nr:hypothetical protein [Rhodosalinus sediminis]
MDLFHRLGERYAERGVAAEYGDAEMDVCDLTIEGEASHRH